MDGLSIRAAGEAAGVSHTAMRKAARSGHIRVMPDGSIDPSGIEEWKAGRRTPRGGNRKSETNDAVSVPTEAPPFVPPTPDASGLFPNRAAAELARDSYAARTKQLEYETKREKLVELDRVVRDVERDYAEVRTKMMAMPSEWAPRMFRCKTILELQELMTTLITEALEALSRGIVA